MIKKVSILLFVLICCAVTIKTSAHNHPSISAPRKAGKDYSQADVVFSESYIDNTFSSALYFRLGIYRLEMNEYETAISDFNKAIDLTPFYADAYLQRAYAKKLSGQQEEALEDFQLAAYLNPILKNMTF